MKKLLLISLALSAFTTQLYATPMTEETNNQEEDLGPPPTLIRQDGNVLLDQQPSDDEDLGPPPTLIRQDGNVLSAQPDE